MRVLAFDIGGTSTLSGIWTGKEITEIKENETPAQEGGAATLENVIKIAKEYSDYVAVGVSSAGVVNSDTGTILFANESIRNYTGTKIKEILEKALNVPVFVDNDVNSAAAGVIYSSELSLKTKQASLFLTYGTGIGGAIILNGEIYRGFNYSAGEFGMTLTHSNDPEGYYENYASTKALVKKVNEKYPNITNGREIFKNIENKEIAQLVDDWIVEIAYGLTSLTHSLDPATIILGGGIMEQDYVFERIKKELPKHLLKTYNPELIQSTLGNFAGMIGAGCNAKKGVERSEK